MLASRLLPIRDEPAVASRWGPLEPGEMDEFVGDERTLVIEVDGDVVGAIQYAEDEDPMSRHTACITPMR